MACSPSKGRSQPLGALEWDGFPELCQVRVRVLDLCPHSDESRSINHWVRAALEGSLALGEAILKEG